MSVFYHIIIHLSCLSLPNLTHFLHEFFPAGEEKKGSADCEGILRWHNSHTRELRSGAGMQKLKQGFAALAGMASAAVLKDFRASFFLVIKPGCRNSEGFNSMAYL